jgi:hypothetical protein
MQLICTVWERVVCANDSSKCAPNCEAQLFLTRRVTRPLFGGRRYSAPCPSASLVLANQLAEGNLQRLAILGLPPKLRVPTLALSEHLRRDLPDNFTHSPSRVCVLGLDKQCRIALSAVPSIEIALNQFPDIRNSLRAICHMCSLPT